MSRRPIFVYWMECKSCDYETVAHGRVMCGECSDVMEPADVAGAVVDDRVGEPEDAGTGKVIRGP